MPARCRSRRTSGRVLLVACLATACLIVTASQASAAGIEQVHYTFTGPTSVTIDWVGAATDIRYGKTTAYGTTVTAHAGTPTPTDSAGPFQEADLNGLEPGTTYHYSIGGGGDKTFTTAPTGDFTFDVEADIGGGLTNARSIQQDVAADAPAFTLVPGDLSYASNGGALNLPKGALHFNHVMPWSVSAAYMPTWGNHEWGEPGASSPPDDLGNYKGRFKLPNAQDSGGPPTGSGEDWSWFDAGGVRFISYPEPYGGSATWTAWQAQADALIADAQTGASSASIRYIVTFGHRPAYSTGSHLGDTTLAGKLNALGDKYSKYVLNLNGHSHDYERFYPTHHVTHVTSGGGGGGLEPPWKTADTDGHPRAMHLEHVRVHVDSTGIHIYAICGPATPNVDDLTSGQGSVIDSYR